MQKVFGWLRDTTGSFKIGLAVVGWLPLVALALIVNSGEFRKDALLVSAILMLWVLRSLRSTYWAPNREVGKTVGGLLAGIVLVDLLAVAHVPTELSAVFLVFFVLSLATQRWVPAT